MDCIGADQSRDADGCCDPTVVSIWSDNGGDEVMPADDDAADEDCDITPDDSDMTSRRPVHDPEHLGTRSLIYH